MLSHSATVFVSRMPLRSISTGGGGRRAVGQGAGAGRHVPLGQGMASGQGSFFGEAGVEKQGGVDDGMQGRCLHVTTGQGATKVGQEVLPARALSCLLGIWAISLTAAMMFPLDAA
jgi:hypothetical protein